MPIPNIGFGQTRILNWAQTRIYIFVLPPKNYIEWDFLYKPCLIFWLQIWFVSHFYLDWPWPDPQKMQSNQFFVFTLSGIFIFELMHIQNVQQPKKCQTWSCLRRGVTSFQLILHIEKSKLFDFAKKIKILLKKYLTFFSFLKEKPFAKKEIASCGQKAGGKGKYSERWTSRGRLLLLFSHNWHYNIFLFSFFFSSSSFYDILSGFSRIS